MAPGSRLETRPSDLHKAIMLCMFSAIVLVVLGLIVPTLRSAHIRGQKEQAAEDLREIRLGIRRFFETTGLGPTRSREGEDRGEHPSPHRKLRGSSTATKIRSSTTRMDRVWLNSFWA